MIMRGIILVAIVISLLACSAESSDKYELKTKEDSLGYALGMQLGMNFRNDSVFFNNEAFAAGLRLGLLGDTLKGTLTVMEQKRVLLEFQNIMLAKQEQKRQKAMDDEKVLADKNAKTAADWLSKNKLQPDIKTTQSGLQYKVIKEGDGISANDDSAKVIVHYVGKLIDGTEFDNSQKRGKPAEFVLGKLIPGWREGLKMMKAGGKYMFFISPTLAYGERRAGSIPPNSVLIFEVDLINVINK